MYLSGALYARLRRALLESGKFGSVEDLKTVFQVEELASHIHALPTNAKNEGDLVDKTIHYLTVQRTNDGKPLIILFIKILIDVFLIADSKLTSDMQQVLNELVQVYQKSHQATATGSSETDQYEGEMGIKLAETRWEAGQATISLPHPYRIDKNFFIEYDLDPQRSKFLGLLENQYRGAFAYAVTCPDGDILREYVIERMIFELNRRNKRYIHTHDIVLRVDDVKGGENFIEKRILSKLNLNQITDLFADQVRSDIVLIIWHDTCLTRFIRPSAITFSMRLKEQVKDFLLQQNRCLVLFWVTVKDHPMDRKFALPSLSAFDVDALTSWLEEQLEVELKAQGAGDDLIESYLAQLKCEIAKWDGHLIKTFAVIRKIA